MKSKIVAGNWKMNLSLQEALDLVNEIEVSNKSTSKEVFLFVPNIYLHPILETVNNKGISIGAQNGHPKLNGAFTGEVSMRQLKQLGINTVLIGHSERRALFYETPEFLKEKVDAALSQELNIFFCCGETLAERKAGDHFEVITTQLTQSLLHIPANKFSDIVIAYEPVWAIGTGETASKEDAEAMHKHIRKIIAKKYGTPIANDLSILYGGSCNATNATSLFAQENIDGGLIGAAALKAREFNQIIKAI